MLPFSPSGEVRDALSPHWVRLHSSLCDVPSIEWERSEPHRALLAA